jgi:hypothetical protein
MPSVPDVALAPFRSNSDADSIIKIFDYVFLQSDADFFKTPVKNAAYERAIAKPMDFGKIIVRTFGPQVTFVSTIATSRLWIPFSQCIFDMVIMYAVLCAHMQRQLRASGYPTMLDFFFDMRRVAFNCVWFNYGSAAHFLCKAVQTVSKSFFDMLCTLLSALALKRIALL